MHPPPPVVQAHFESVNALLAHSWNESFILTKASSLVNHLANLFSHAILIYNITSTHNSSLATWCLMISLVFVVRRYMGFLHESATVSAITDENYRRSEIMYRAGGNTDAQDQVSPLTDSLAMELGLKVTLVSRF